VEYDLHSKKGWQKGDPKWWVVKELKKNRHIPPRFYTTARTRILHNYPKLIRTKTIMPKITGRKQQLSNRSDYKNNGIRIDPNGDYNSRIAEQQIQIHG